MDMKIRPVRSEINFLSDFEEVLRRFYEKKQKLINTKKTRLKKNENYENYIFGKKEKAAFRDADRKKCKTNLKNPEISRKTGPDIRGSRGRRSGEAPIFNEGINAGKMSRKK